MNQNTGEHIYYEYTNPQTNKTVQDYMNKWEWEAIQRSKDRRNDYTLLKEINLNEGESASSEGAKEEITSAPEIVEDALECPLCGYVAKDTDDLQDHKKEEHV